MSDMDRTEPANKPYEYYKHERSVKTIGMIVPVGFVDAVRELIKAAWSVRALIDCYMTAAHGEYYQKKIESVESMLPDMDKKEDV